MGLLGCSTNGGSLVFRNSNQGTQSFIYRVCIGEHFGDVRFEANDVTEALPAWAELSDPQSLQVVIRPKLVVLIFLILLHKLFAQLELLVGH